MEICLELPFESKSEEGIINFFYFLLSGVFWPSKEISASSCPFVVCMSLLLGTNEYCWLLLEVLFQFHLPMTDSRHCLHFNIGFLSKNQHYIQSPSTVEKRIRCLIWIDSVGLVYIHFNFVLLNSFHLKFCYYRS